MVYLPLWKILVSLADDIPNIWKVLKFMLQTTYTSHIFGPSSVTTNGPWSHRHIVRVTSGLHELGDLCQGDYYTIPSGYE